MKNKKQDVSCNITIPFFLCWALAISSAYGGSASAINTSLFDRNLDWNPQYVVDVHSDTLTFERTSIPLIGIHGGAASWFDYDNDGDLDILLSGSTESGYVTKIYRNDDGTFVPLDQELTGVAPEHTAVWADFDNDGDFDFFIAGLHNDTSGVGPVSKIFRNDQGTFVDMHAPIQGLQGGAAAWGDYDYDGDLDLIVTGSPDNGYSFFTKLYRNDGAEFTEVFGTPFPGVWGSSVAWGDYDNDGDLDFLISGWSGTSNTRLYENGGGGFREVSTPFVQVASSAVAFADYDNDGDLDVIVTGTVPGGAGVTKLYRNNGGGSFTDTHAPLVGIGVGSIAWGDIDNDGDLDLVLSGAQNFNGSGTITVLYRNDGTTFTQLPDSLEGGWFTSLSFGDYDKDGRLDLLYSGASSNVFPYGRKTIIYRNIYPVQNTPPSTPSNLSASVNTNSVQLVWDAATDGQTSTGGLTYNVRVGQSHNAIDIVAPNSSVGTGYRRIPLPGNVNTHHSLNLKNLSPGTYYWNVQSVDHGYEGSAFAGERSFTIGGVASWEIISVPFNSPDMRKSVLFTNSVSPAFSFNGSYHIATDLENGKGYWLKFTPEHPHQISSGTPVTSLTLPVQPGWNMIGSLSSPLPVSSVVPVGTTLISSFFGYHGTYEAADSIIPGSGYWIKVSQAGSLDLNSSAAVPIASQKISVREVTGTLNALTFQNEKGSQQLYFGTKLSGASSSDWFELPPVPPQSDLDVRFASQKLLEINDGVSPKEYAIRITSSSYPVTISWNINTATEGVITSGGNSASLAKSRSIRVETADENVTLRFSGVKERPAAYALGQNYPNPFNPATEIRFALRDAGLVTLKLFDLLGREVGTLVNEEKQPGEYAVTWDASGFASGMYFYELKAGSFGEVRKMMLVR